MDLIGLDNSSIIRPKRFSRNLGRLLIDIDPIRARLIEFITQIINTLDRDKLLD
jgi:hypothetical protein